MSKRAEDLADKIYPFRYDSHGDVIDFKNTIILRGVCIEIYEQAKKDTIERAVAWLEETFFDNSHHSGRGIYGQIETNDFDSMEEMIEKFKKAMEEEE